MAKNYDYFNVDKARKNLQDKKEAIYNHFNISHKIPEILPEVCQKCEVYDSIYK
jgi:hypothetical protein